jgi:hypothetical protein
MIDPARDPQRPRLPRTIKCPRCRVDVPADKIHEPNRCHAKCPLYAMEIAEILAYPVSAFLLGYGLAVAWAYWG